MKFHARMTKQENEDVMAAAMDAAYTGKTVNFSDYVKTEALIVSHGDDPLLLNVGKAVLVALLLVAFLVGGVLRAEASAGPPAVEGCVEDFDHHNPASNPYFNRLLSSANVYIHKATNSLIAFVKIRECGRYLIGIWRNGVFATSFLANWGYVSSQIGGFAKAAWTSVRMAGAFIIAVPCPGTWTEFRRPCPGGGSNE